MSIPAAVQKQLDQASQLISRATEPAAPGNPQITTPQQVAPNGPQPGNEPPAPVNPPQASMQPPQQSFQPEQDPNYWRNRFSVVQGINASQANEIATLKKRTSELEAEISRLQTAAPSLQGRQPQPGNDQPWNNVLSEEEREAYPPEFFSMVANVAKSVSAGQPAPQAQPSVPVTQPQPQAPQSDARFESLAARTKEYFAKELNGLCPRWQQINSDQRFIDWLSGQIDPRTGMSALDELRSAYQTFDAQACAQYFLTFERMVFGQQGHTQLMEPNPSGGMPPGHGNPQQTRIFTAAEYRRHYDEKTKGLWNHRMAEWEEIRKELDRAFSEGRVR